MGLVEDRLTARGLILPPPIKLPAGVILPFPEVNLRGNQAFVSGVSALEADGALSAPQGRLGETVSVQEGYELAQKTGLAVLAGLKRSLGDLDRITGWCKVFGMVKCTQDFQAQPAVINGFSDLILDLFGSDIGRHARSAVGMSALPMNIAVEIEAQVEFRV